MTAKPEISLIISTYQSPAPLEKVFRGLRMQSVSPLEILIADDGSGEPTRKLIESWTPRLGLRHLWHEDTGFRKAAILNKSLAAAKGNYIVFLDGDCVPHRHFIKDHAALAENNFWVQGRRCFIKEEFVAEFQPETVSIFKWLLQGKITGTAKALRLPFPLIRRNQKQRGIIGCNMAYWRDDLLTVNGFDEEYTGWGLGEDSDLGVRLYHLGRSRKFVYGRSIIYHLNHPQTSREQFQGNVRRFAETLASKKIRCARGLNQYL